MRKITLVAAALCLFVASDIPAYAADGSGVAAYVNGEPVTNREIGHTGGRAADEQAMRKLDDAVARKALARVARMTGLDGSPEFRAKVRDYEEYLLVDELIERKSRELAGEIEITDEEAAEFARRMCYTITYVKTEFGEKKDAENFMDGVIRNRPAEWESEYTVVACEGVGLRMLDRLFKMDEGGVFIFGRGTRYYVVKVIERERTSNPDDLPGWEEVRAYLLKKKVDEAIETWIDSVVERAEVRYLVEPAKPGGGHGGAGAPRPTME